MYRHYIYSSGDPCGRHASRKRLQNVLRNDLLYDNSGLHEWVNLAMVSVCAGFGKGVAKRSTTGGEGGIDARIERCAVIAGEPPRRLD